MAPMLAGLDDSQTTLQGRLTGPGTTLLLPSFSRVASASRMLAILACLRDAGPQENGSVSQQSGLRLQRYLCSSLLL